MSIVTSNLLGRLSIDLPEGDEAYLISRGGGFAALPAPISSTPMHQVQKAGKFTITSNYYGTFWR